MGELAKGLPEGSKLVIFLSPFRSEAGARPRDPWLRDFDKSGGYRRLADDLAKGGLDVIEIRGAAFTGSSPDTFADDIHFTPKGADEIARLMWDELKPRLSDGLPAPGPRPEPKGY